MLANYQYNLGHRWLEVSTIHGDQIALHFSKSYTVTYSELFTLSCRVAHLLKSKKVQKGSVVAIFNNKSTEGFASMLACLILGAPYVNIDTTSPAIRQHKMIQLCKPTLILSDKSEALSEVLDDECPTLIDYTSLSFQEELQTQANEWPQENNAVTGEDLAYLMFTSGSTGFPKAAMMSHANVLNFIQWSMSTFQTSPSDIFSNLNPMHFDNSVFDFYASVFTGASMIPVAPEQLKNPKACIDHLEDLQCSHWFSVPSLLVYSLRLRAMTSNSLPSLKNIIFGGEGFPKKYLRELFHLIGHRCELINVYGPTECTCICSSYPVSESDLDSDALLPLGRLAPNFSFEILTDHNLRAKTGERGELCLSGPNVGKGYAFAPEQTAAKFIANPFNIISHEVMYRSGDLVSCDNKSGLLHFHGRIDNQIKRMGYRIELEEIEIAAAALPCVHSCAATFRQSADGLGKIELYVVSNISDEIKLTDDLRLTLPPYMIPDNITFIDSIPLNSNGKIDRNTLVELKMS